MTLLETLKQLFLAMDKLHPKNLSSQPHSSSTHKIVDFHEIFSNLCLQSANLTKLLMVLYFGTISIIEDFF